MANASIKEMQEKPQNLITIADKGDDCIEVFLSDNFRKLVKNPLYNTISMVNIKELPWFSEHYSTHVIIKSFRSIEELTGIFFPDKKNN